MSDGGQMMADAYVEIGPGDVDYARFAASALTGGRGGREAPPVAGGRRATTAAVPRFSRPRRPSRTRARRRRWSRAWLETSRRPPENQRRLSRAGASICGCGCGCGPRAFSTGCGMAEVRGFSALQARGVTAPSDRPQATGRPPPSSARTSDSRNRRCPPGVRMLLIRPDAAQRVTVFGSTRNRAATPRPEWSSRSLLPSIYPTPPVHCTSFVLSVATNMVFSLVSGKSDLGNSQLEHARAPGGGVPVRQGGGPSSPGGGYPYGRCGRGLLRRAAAHRVRGPRLGGCRELCFDR